MSLNIPLPLKLAALRYNLVAGEVPPAQLIVLDETAIIGTVRSLMGRRNISDVFALLSGGTMSVAGYASVWENRMDFLSSLERLLPVLPVLQELSDLEIYLVMLSKSEMVASLLASGASEALIQAAIQVMDPHMLRTNLLEVGVGVDLKVLLTQEIDLKDIPIVLGALLWDLSLPEVAARAPLAVAFLAPVWHTVFVKAASAAPDDAELTIALDVIEAVTALSIT